MKILPIKTNIFHEGDDLAFFIQSHIPRLPERSVLVVTSKIAALSEKRTAPIGNRNDFNRLVRAESDYAVKTKHVWLTLKNGMLMPNAGIDSSNAHGKFVLLPKDSFKTAARLRAGLTKHYRVKHLGVLITDSRTAAYRAGVTAVALGYAGFRGVRDYIGTPDLFGRKFKFSRTNVADSLSTAAVLCMGEGAERQPLAVITDAPIVFSSRVDHTELYINPTDDMYAPLLKKLKK